MMHSLAAPLSLRQWWQDGVNTSEVPLHKWGRCSGLSQWRRSWAESRAVSSEKSCSSSSLRRFWVTRLLDDSDTSCWTQSQTRTLVGLHILSGLGALWRSPGGAESISLKRGGLDSGLVSAAVQWGISRRKMIWRMKTSLDMIWTQSGNKNVWFHLKLKQHFIFM